MLFHSSYFCKYGTQTAAEHICFLHIAISHKNFFLPLYLFKVKMEFRNVSLLLLLLLASLSTVSADQDYDDAYQAGDDAAEGDDAQGDDAQGDDAQQANDDDASQYYDDGSGFSAGDDYIKYWTDYAILPKRCIV
jgi:hypothetical protein